jgi:AmmeMemoRadiSam system protein B
MERIRPPAVAGSFYPSEADELSRLSEQCFLSNPLGPQGVKFSPPSLLGGLVPHAGYVYSGACAAHLYARLNPSIQRVIVLGVNHWGNGHRAALSPADLWRTPCGAVRVDQELSHRLQDQVHFLKPDELAHAREHSIEVQLPLLQYVLGEFTLVPISLGHISLEECAQLGAALASICTAQADPVKRPVIVASSDLNHYLSPEETAELDEIALDAILALNPQALLDVVERKNITMCGVLPTAVLLFAASVLGAKRASLLNHCHSGATSPMRKVVGYASVAVEL